MLSTAAMTADYAVASRAFEVARLPLAIIAPILLSQFARLLINNTLSEDKQRMVKQLFTIEMFIAMFIPLVGNILWAPVLDSWFHGKYGTVNATEFMLLSICIPLQFGINLLWTLSFSGRRYKQISSITIYSAITNIVISLVLIPKLGSLGAAISFLTTSVLQLIGHFFLVRKNLMTTPVHTFVLFLIVAAVSYVAAIYITDSIVGQVLISTVLYIVLSLVFRLVRKEHLQTLKLFTGR
jgi:O-antigen/teichoic acid export membrane protein